MRWNRYDIWLVNGRILGRVSGGFRTVLHAQAQGHVFVEVLKSGRFGFMDSELGLPMRIETCYRSFLYCIKAVAQ